MPAGGPDNRHFMMPPRVSVIIPCYNQGQFIDEAVASVLAQSFQDFEIIIVNDGSTDEETCRILAGYDRPKTRVVATENQGLAAARNNGIREAGGRYILPLDADDRIGPAYLERAVRLLDERAELGIVYCRAQLFGAVDTEWRLPQFSLEEMLLDNVIFCSALFRRQDWQRVGGYDQDLKYGWEDYDFWLSLLELGRRVYRIPEILFYYRVSADSMVRARPRRHKLETFTAIYRKHQPLFSEHIEVWIDRLLDLREPYHEASLSLGPPGADGGVSPLVRKVDLDTRRLEFDLADSESRRPIRFLPANDYVVLTLERITCEVEGAGTPLTRLTSNADFQEGQTYFFGSTTPCFQVDPPLSPDGCRGRVKLIFELRYHAFGRECVPHFTAYHHRHPDGNHQPDGNRNAAADNPGPHSRLTAKQAVFRRRLWLIRFFVSRPFEFFSRCRHYLLVRRSGLVDRDFYLQNDPAMDPLLVDPLIHYLETGWREGRQPNLLFFTGYYAGTCPESTGKGMSPLVHYLETGCRQGKNPNPFFDSAFYLAQNSRVIPAGMNPLAHYLRFGSTEQFHPLAFFDTAYYAEDNPAVVKLRIPLLLHYLGFGAREGRSPNRFFDPVFYRRQYDIADPSGWEAFNHYVSTGCERQLRPNPLFDPRFYAETYPEFRETHPYPLLHYQETGVRQGCYPCREVADLPKKPVISILTPVYDTDESLLRKCIHSVLYQAYPHWELCLVDDGSSAPHIRPLLEEYAALDPRIRISFLAGNQGISAASNKAASLAGGDYLGFLDHDDELTLDALYLVARAINEHDPDVLYSDEDLVNRESRYLESFFKPDFNQELLLCHNYITHFLVTRQTLFAEVGGFSEQCDGSQDYDLLLKLTEPGRRVYHLPETIYHWRAIETSTSINHTQKDYADSAGLEALKAAIRRRGLEASVQAGQWRYYYEVRRQCRDSVPVALFVLLRDEGDETEKWLERLARVTGYEKLEFHLLSRQPGDSDRRRRISSLDHRFILHDVAPDEKNGPALNRVIAQSAARQLLFLDHGVLPLHETWVETLLGYSQDPALGVVGGLVEYDDRENDNGALPDLNDEGCEAYRRFFIAGSCHLNGLVCPQNVLAVGAELCMVKRQLFDRVHGFDEGRLANVMYDIDFSLRVRQQGVENVFSPYCKAGCPEGRRLLDLDEQARQEKERFQERWRRDLLAGNPYYNERRIFQDAAITKSDWINWYAGLKTERELVVGPRR
ncbi:chondroitin synthase [bacterium BMS3Abin13]|nr:chondroitin synthase [bacterium BMS3Abin13]